MAQLEAEAYSGTTIKSNATNILLKAKGNEQSLEPPLDYELASPMWLTDLFVNRPRTVIIFGAIIILSFTAVVLYFETYVPSPMTNRDYFI